jgi:DNA-3-methyladenine glycosylase
LWIEKPTDYRRPRVVRATRIGVDYAGDWAQKPWRFYDGDSIHVSTAKRKKIKAV